MDEVLEESIAVAVRIRPMQPRELDIGAQEIWEVASSNSIKECGVDKFFVYDRVFDSSCTNQQVFDEFAEKIVWNTMEGFNGCIFCYGQTGSGKTFTMHGNRSKAPGIVPLAIDTIFAYIEETPEKEFLFRCSYIEIYNECVNDLLSNSLNLQLQEDKVRGIKIVGAVEEVCKSADQVFSLLQIGETNKQIGSTNYNLRSSRSHSIFRLTVESKSREAGGKGLTIATCNLIDLAGSESMKAHGPASSIHRKREMNYINKVSSI